MISTKTKVVVALSGLALAAVVLPGAIAAGTNGPPPVPITGGGVLRLHMAKDADFFRFDPPAQYAPYQSNRRGGSDRPPRVGDEGAD